MQESLWKYWEGQQGKENEGSFIITKAESQFRNFGTRVSMEFGCVDGVLTSTKSTRKVLRG